jgi:hypothetical protein
MGGVSMELFVVAAWLLACCFVAAIASGRGRSAVGYFSLSLVLSPLFGLIVVLVVGPNRRSLEMEQLRSGTSRRCPFCAEVVRSEAIVCRFCGRDLPEGSGVTARATWEVGVPAWEQAKRQQQH